MSKADEKIEHLVMVLSIIKALMKGHSSNFELEEIIRILENLKSDKINSYKSSFGDVIVVSDLKKMILNEKE